MLSLTGIDFHGCSALLIGGVVDVEIQLLRVVSRLRHQTRFLIGQHGLIWKTRLLFLRWSGSFDWSTFSDLPISSMSVCGGRCVSHAGKHHRLLSMRAS